MPDLEVLHVVDPETGEPSAGPGELVLTQLGLRGSALLRWRTGDLVDGIDERPCPACGRRVPRVLGLRRRALVPDLDLRSGRAPVDLRPLAGTLAGRTDLDDWRLEVRRSPRDGYHQVLVHVAPSAGTPPATVARAVARDLQTGAGVLPTQVLLADRTGLPEGAGPSARVLHPLSATGAPA
jgi:hypothetical protein